MEGDCHALFVYQVPRASAERQGEVSGCWIQMNIGFVFFDNQTIFSSNVHQCSSWLDHYSKLAATTLAIWTVFSARRFRLAFLNRAVSSAPFLVLCSSEAQNTQLPIEESWTVSVFQWNGEIFPWNSHWKDTTWVGRLSKWKPRLFEGCVGIGEKIVLILLMEDILHRDCESHIHRASNPHPSRERKGHIPGKIWGLNSKPFLDPLRAEQKCLR